MRIRRGCSACRPSAKAPGFVVSAVLIGAGRHLRLFAGLYHHRLVYRDDTNLNLIVYSLLGGMGTLFGPVIGAFMLDVHHPGGAGAPARLSSLRHRVAAGLPGARRPGGVLGFVRSWRLAAPAAARRRPNERSPILRVEALSKRFRGLLAISDVSFAVEPGSITSVIGPNGAGKSTLFNLVTGYLAPTAGRVSFKERPITGMATNRIAELGVARAFQIARPFRDLSVAENVRIGALFGKAGRATSRRRPARPGARRHGASRRGTGERAHGRPAPPSRGGARRRHARRPAAGRRALRRPQSRPRRRR